VRARW